MVEPRYKSEEECLEGGREYARMMERIIRMRSSETRAQRDIAYKAAQTFRREHNRACDRFALGNLETPEPIRQDPGDSGEHVVKDGRVKNFPLFGDEEDDFHE